MVDITAKSNTLRKAIAQATLKVSSEETMIAIRERKVPKGDVFEFARAAGLLAIKKTSDVIPDCHPLPIEFAHISYELEEMEVLISVEVHTIYKTGVEVEAMHGASVTALTMYDMLKPIDKEVEIQHIRLLKKEGGKSDFSSKNWKDLMSAVVVCSDTVSRGEKTDRAGKALISRMEKLGLLNIRYEVVPDDEELIRQLAGKLTKAGIQLTVFCGGTGLSERDVTAEAVAPLLDRSIPGVMETARAYGQQRMPYAMLSRGMAGFYRQNLLLTFPGSTKGATETFDALFPAVLHVFEVKKGVRHDP